MSIFTKNGEPRVKCISDAGADSCASPRHFYFAFGPCDQKELVISQAGLQGQARRKGINGMCERDAGFMQEIPCLTPMSAEQAILNSLFF